MTEEMSNTYAIVVRIFNDHKIMNTYLIGFNFFYYLKNTMSYNFTLAFI